ncbi:MAG: hypothetical protein IKN11_07700 [Bacteroidales bacterium]|nr:hypothetical protein [Bacteroidales bacterium]
MKKKQTLFLIGPVDPKEMADIVPSQGSDAASLADELLVRANAWLSAGKINFAQYDLFKKRLKETPAVVDAKLDGDVIVCALADGTEHRILPDDANLPEVIVTDSRDTWTLLGITWKKKYWIATFSATAVLIAVLSIVAAKHR